MSLVVKKTNTEDITTRLKFGKAGEKEVIQDLRNMGVTFYETDDEEDRFAKIDGRVLVDDILLNLFPVFKKFEEYRGGKVTVQIKFRASGNDFEYELFTDRYQRDGKGRELKSKAAVMFCKSNGTIGAALMGGMRKTAEYLYNKNPEAFSVDERHTEVHPDGWAELKRVEDESKHEDYGGKKHFWKVLLYVKKNGGVKPPCTSKNILA